MEAACAEMGRDPSTLEITLLRIVAYPELVPLPSDFPPYVTGTAEAIAAELGRYEQLGVGHVMLECTPTTPDTLQRLSAALERYRQGAGGVQG